MEFVELENVRDALVSMPGVTRLLIEKRKMIEIVVKIVINHSIILAMIHLWFRCMVS